MGLRRWWRLRRAKRAYGMNPKSRASANAAMSRYEQREGWGPNPPTDSRLLQWATVQDHVDATMGVRAPPGAPQQNADSINRAAAAQFGEGNFIPVKPKA